MTDMTDNNNLEQQAEEVLDDSHLTSHAHDDSDMPNETHQEHNKDVIPAVDVALSGRHLIEASAGTGKTWTLTGIVLRLLIEARRAPEQIIATTFTRAAAAEMRQRIHDRLVDFYQLLQWVNNLSADLANKQHLYPDILQVVPESSEDNKEDKKADSRHDANSADSIGADELNQDLAHDKQREAEQKATAKKNRAKWLVEQAEYARLDDIMQDPINLHLVGYLLDHVYSYPMTDAIRRTALVLTTLDKLFVGTLDSLAQKWLAEYSSETGHQQGMAIIEDSSIEQVTDSIIHDELRQFQSRLYYEQPKLYALIEQQGKLTAVEDHKSYVKRSLNFISAPIDDVISVEFSIDEYESFLKQYCEFDFADIQPYLDITFRRKEGFNNRKSVAKNLGFYQEFKELIREYNLTFYTRLSDPNLNFLEQLKATDEGSEDCGFNEGNEQGRIRFVETESVQMMLRLYDYIQKIENYIISVLANLNRNIVLAVRERLPVILEERGETTFSLQMVRLNQALTGRQGEKLARYIRHHYPVALIDESQDINGEQAIMIERIYLPKNKRQQGGNEVKQSTSNKSNQEFLLLVGDPKQAIYGFRGGDVANYNYMKSQFDNKHIWTLDINRRSNAAVINALNHWFGVPTRTTKQSRIAGLGDNIYYQFIEAANPDAKLSWLQSKIQRNNNDSETESYQHVLPNQAVSVINLPYDKDAKYKEHEITARHIATILNSGQTLNGKPVQPSDIGVLARAKKDLKRVEDELVKLNVPTLTTSDVSIFETIMAEDVAALLSAMLYPYRHDMINRVLTSHLYGLTIKEVKAMMTDHESGIAQSDETSSKGAVNAHSTNNGNTQGDTSKKSYQDFISYLKEGAQRWQNFGILSAMHYLLDKSPVQPQGVWQALAAHPEGDRHIMDLRHVMDILAQYGIGMGEHELLAWFRENIDAAPNSDWAKQYPLPTESGVQLMTIHKSKGLEFPIVYVLGMGSAIIKSGMDEKYGLYLYNVEKDNGQKKNTMLEANKNLNIADNNMTNLRRFSPVQGTKDNKDLYTNFETKESFDERKRLGYVAFTRASEQLYIVLTDPHRLTKDDVNLRPVVFWFESNQKEYQLPERLKGAIGYLPGNQITKFYEDSYANSKTHNLTDSTEATLTQSNLERIKYDNFSDVMRVNYFYGWAKTSFTALARQLDDSTQAMAVVDERIDDATYIDISEADGALNAQIEDQGLPVKAVDDIRFSFVKGANAGTFLHEIFEKIHFTDPDQWPAVIDRAVSGYQLPLAYASVAHQKRILEGGRQGANNKTYHIDERGLQHQALMTWVDEVLHTPLLASGQKLVDISPKQRFAEIGFNMGLSETFQAQQINTLFEKHLPYETDKHIRLTAQSSSQLYRYLRGEIDLVYEHAGKFYVVDYKSNFLGNSLSNYDEATLKVAMSKAGYWLQAAIYQVALHRFLSMRIADYKGNEAKYLGPVEYVFLRGAYQHLAETQSMNNDIRYGLVTWDIPIEFIKALDKLFGKPQ